MSHDSHKYGYKTIPLQNINPIKSKPAMFEMVDSNYYTTIQVIRNVTIIIISIYHTNE